MYQIDFNKPVNVHFIGIGGISMSGLAEILLDRGFKISGSDRDESTLTAQLKKKGALIFYGQKAENIPKSCDAVVYTAAIRPENPEYAAALSRGIPMLSRAELLGQLMKHYKSSVAVAGTHGKTTTTSMLAHIFLCAGIDPTVSVGGILPAINGNIRIGSDECFLTEACEYTDSFLSFLPTAEVILNVEEDHLDYFKDIDAIRASFKKFAELLPERGVLVINADIEDVSYFTEDLNCGVITYSISRSADYTVSDIKYDSFARPSFTVLYKNEPLSNFNLNVYGEHNISNALAAVAAARFLGIETDCIKNGLASFTGTERRFQIKGKVNNALIVDDYAHHPTEIEATLKTALNYPHKRLWCVFQPHTYSRTQAFLDDFAKSLNIADEVILAEIYPAREENIFGVSSEDIAKRMPDHGQKCRCFSSFKEIEDYVLSNLEENDMLITMGAGNINEVGEHLIKENN